MLVVAALVASGIAPYDRLTWLLEVAPVLIALPLLWFTRKRYPLTGLVYGLIMLHSLVLILGTQGYQWDTQSDMLLALIGSTVALLLLSSFHVRQMAGLRQKP